MWLRLEMFKFAMMETLLELVQGVRVEVFYNRYHLRGLRVLLGPWASNGSAILAKFSTCFGFVSQSMQPNLPTRNLERPLTWSDPRTLSL